MKSRSSRSRPRECFAPAPTVSWMTSTLLLLCLQARESWLTLMEAGLSRVKHRMPAAEAGIVSVKGAAGPAGARRVVRLLCAGWLPQDRVSS
jgi:hypothetical protein